MLVKSALNAGLKVNAKSLKLLIWNKGVKTHKPTKILKGYYAVYIFEYKGKILKVGRSCGIKNNDRYYWHHYLPNGAKSTLAKSLGSNEKYSKLIGKEKISDWMIKNLNRYNLLIPIEYGKHFINFAEAFFILKYNPLFEGKITLH